MMQTFMSLIILLILISCNRTKAHKIKEESMKISVQVARESDSSYYIKWEDTLGKSKGYELYNRPFEIWCVLTASHKIVGYYKGLSTPSNFAYFSTKDSITTAIFMIGPNIFSDLYWNGVTSKKNEKIESLIEFI